LSKMAQLLDFCTLYIFPASGGWFCPSLGMINCCFFYVFTALYTEQFMFIHLSQSII
jgi:hypothetical protein